MSDDLRDKIARAVAKAQDADYWVDEIAHWETQDEWERKAYPGEYPGLAYEDQHYFRQAADAVLTVIDLDKVRAEAQVEALREVAQAWQTGGWAQDMPQRDYQRPQLIVGMAQRATDFIRDRADRIAREAGIETGEADD